MIPNLLKLTLGLALLRTEPQEMPYSPQLTRGLAALAVACATLLMSLMLGWPKALAASIGGVAAVAFFTQTLLRARRREARLLQTLAAKYAVGSLFLLALYPPFSVLAPLMVAAMNDPALFEQLRSGKAALPGSALPSLVVDVLAFWSLLVSMRTNRAATELNTPASWLVTLAALLVLLSFVAFSQLLVLPLVK